jgi:hypothetical protein
MLIDLAEGLTTSPQLHLNLAQSMILADCFDSAFVFAHDFNRNRRCMCCTVTYTVLAPPSYCLYFFNMLEHLIFAVIMPSI